MTNKLLTPTPSRRSVLTGLAAGGALVATGFAPRFAQAQSSAPIKLGFQLHRTGIGASYGRWYERTATAALNVLNEAGGINGRPVEIVFEDDGTDPKRGAEVVEKLIAGRAKFGMSERLKGLVPRSFQMWVKSVSAKSKGKHKKTLEDIRDIIVCPVCKGKIKWHDSSISCQNWRYSPEPSLA